ncbi:hypothetical protein [Flavobacterium sangjuense]|uniref:Lipoprotein n=1 Tax=Flavobacterium sangjuense TaxID=2518177 RepID=A0A4P7PUE6_9FLAO|nr:hypothetical protein [Flavobacterium sangjuense]QBZ98356.1 hypothetical protein GS03_01861 [Flavobacterium sangjuense]
MKKILLLGLISCLFLSCKKEHKIANVERAFYYWKSDNWNISQKEDSISKKLNVKKLYVKFFEVDYSDAMGNFPISKTQLYLYNLDSITIVPTVYIKNAVFLKSNQASLDTLADNVNFLITKFYKEKFREAKPLTEFQMDCDWTLKSKDNYFYFLKKLKSISQKEISCTLRLYPYKYPDKMGVPPVDKATLMCYNILNPLQNHTKNSILDIDELESYLDTDKIYPKHLDVALPIYSWMQVYKNEQFSNVIYTDNKMVKKLLKEIKPLWYSVTKDTVINETYLRIGDKVKFEEIDARKIEQTIHLLKKYVSFDKNTTVSLFHLDDEQLSNYTNEELSGFYSAFSK